MANIKIEKRNISFDDAKLKFSNNGLLTDSSSNESIDSIGKKFKYEVKLPGVIHTTARKNNVGDGLNELNARKEANSAVPKPNVIEEKKVTLAAENELETVKFLKTLSKKERENLGFSPKQQKVETSKKTYNPLDWNPIYQGKKRFSLDNMSSNSSSCSEKSNISDISDKSNNSNIVRCNITRSNSKEDICKPGASHNDKSADKRLSNVNVSELIRKFEQGNNIVKGR